MPAETRLGDLFISGSRTLALCASVLVLAAPAAIGGLTVGVAHAQDEFDDEFDDQPEPQPAQPSQTQQPSGGGDEFDDEFGGGGTGGGGGGTSGGSSGGDDELGDGGGSGGSSSQSQSTPDSSGNARGRGGDLLNDRARPEWRDRRIVLHNTWGGTVGGIHAVDAGSGPSESFRVQLLTDFFFTYGYLAPDQNYDHIGGSLSMSWSPWDFIEIYGAIASYANSTSDPTASPNLIQVLGDSTLGIKLYAEVLPFLILGGDVTLALLNTVGDIGLVGESTSVGIRLNATIDFREIETSFPLVTRFNFQYWVDNSSALTNRIEQARYENLPLPREEYANETANLLTRFERTALGINRMDNFNMSIGLEAPITVLPDFTISPIAEWHVAIPVNRQGYNCLYDPELFMMGADDGCLAEQGFDSFPSTFSLGVRVMPPFRGLSFTLAVDVGTTGMATFVRELAGNAPYDVILGAGYAFDAQPRYQEVVREVVREVDRTVPPPVRGRIVGTVVEQGTGTPISGATVAYVGRDFTAQTTGGDGRFVSYEVDPGEVTVDLSHPEYYPNRCSATVGPQGGDVEVRCELAPTPRMGSVQGIVRSDGGASVSGAQVQVTGPQAFTATTDGGGQFSRSDLPPGQYTARVDAEGYLITQESFTVEPRQTARPEITAVARPRRSLVSLRAREIIIRRQVNFVTDSAEIESSSSALLAEIADALIRHPDIRLVEIQGHTDSSGDNDHNLDLSQRRAEAVRSWLIQLGVEPDRLTARGYGETRPLVPNITAGNRARNRRVQFIIQERQ